MLRKAFFTVLTAAASVASAQSFDPNAGYPPTPGAYGNPDQGGLDDSRFDYRRAQGPNGNYNGYNPNNTPTQNPGYNSQPQPGYDTRPNPRYEQPNAGQVAPINMQSVQMTSTRTLQIAVPQGWKLVDQQNLTLAVSPSGAAGYGIVTGIDLPGQATPEQYFSAVFPKVMQIPGGVQIGKVQPGQSQNGMQTAVVQFMYGFQGQQFMGMATVTVQAGQGGTRGMINVVAGTQPEMQANGGAMVQLLGSIRPAGQSAQPTQGGYGNPQNGGYAPQGQRTGTQEYPGSEPTNGGRNEGYRAYDSNGR